MPKELAFKIGADPEFNITMFDKKISARKIIESLFKKDDGTREERDEFESNMGYKIAEFGTLGWDGCDATAELRPNPNNTVEGLTKNIENLIKVFAEKSETFDLSVISSKGSVGGHIHFEMPPEIINNSKKIQVMHKQMTAFYLPIMMGENKLNLKIRNKCNYGNMADFKTDNGGGRRPTTYEFRVPSAEWIVSPKICQATLGYLAVVYNEIIKHQDNMKKHKEILYKTEKQGEALQNLALSDYSFLTTVLLNRIRKAIRTFELYPDFKEEIEYMLNPSKVLKDKTKVDFNLLCGWNFNKSKIPTKEELLNAKLVEERTMAIDMDTIEQLIWVGFNNDTNVEGFVREIKKRIVALKWKLGNEYFFFGLRKGINEYIIANKNIEFIKGQELVKTTSDMASLVTTFEKIRRKMTEVKGNKLNDPKKIIMIGIPYEERIKNNFRKFIEIIYELEKSCEPQTIERKNLADDRFQVTGEIAKVYSEKKDNIRNLEADNSRMRQVEDVVSMVTQEANCDVTFIDEVNENNNSEVDESADFDDDCDEDNDPCDGCDGDCDGCEHHETSDD